MSYLLKAYLICGLVLISQLITAQYYQNDPALIETTSGLKYKITKEGSGEFPKSGDQVWVHYYTKFTNDSLFDTSIDKGPLDVFLGQGQIIKGWEEGLRLIKPGGSILLVVPPYLGYGTKEFNGIPANSTLIFEINLIQVNKGRAIEPFKTDGLTIQKSSENLNYYIVKKGNGPLAKNDDVAYIHYSGFLPDGSLFDSSHKKKNPVRVTIGINQLFKGLDIGLMLMNKGSKLQLIVPSELAYGEKGFGNIVPPNTNITFDVEMVDLKTPPTITKWNTADKEVKETLSGLKYIVIEQGKGDSINTENIVKVNYSGFFTDGKLFDSSLKRFEPIEFPVGIGAVIDGWDEGILLMHKGAKFELIVPSKLAYGEEGMPPLIPENTDLIFDIEIIEVIK
ncbi:MAG: FKBP-type peptidyl-prolyl cis-trans isomerase [Salinivirgaceae bacterium]|jgi:peptidylprolyl isomerase|nr:FKBP-type peptidyl-prolyl cis-trans isomerase [Salinivirgaceae bacterium]